MFYIILFIIAPLTGSVFINRDVAELYGVETKHINQALRNNPDKFPEGYVISLAWDDLDSSRSKFLTLNGSGRGHNIKYLPKAFTEKGLYMLATILKSPVAMQTTIAVVLCLVRGERVLLDKDVAKLYECVK